MIFYNGQTGSLGSYFKAATSAATPINFRLDPTAHYDQNFKALFEETPEEEVTLLPLAGMVSVPACEQDPKQAELINVTETARMTESFIQMAQESGKETKIIYVSTGHVYAEVQNPKKLVETSATAPRSVYAKTKLLAERRLSEIAQSHRVSLKILRVFGLVAPQQPPHYILQSLIRRVKNRDLSGIPGLSFHRDYLDSRDVCRSILTVLEKSDSSSPSLFNICSGEPIQIRHVVDEIAHALEIPSRDYENILTEGQKRSDDVPWIVGDPSLYKKTFGASPQNIPLRKTIQEAIQNSV